MVARFDIHVAVKLNQAQLLIVERAVGGDLIVLVFSRRENLKVYLLEFVMAVGVGDIARGAQPKVESILFRDALLVTVDDAGDFSR